MPLGETSQRLIYFFYRRADPRAAGERGIPSRTSARLFPRAFSPTTSGLIFFLPRPPPPLSLLGALDGAGCARRSYTELHWRPRIHCASPKCPPFGLFGHSHGAPSAPCLHAGGSQEGARGSTTHKRGTMGGGGPGEQLFLFLDPSSSVFRLESTSPAWPPRWGEGGKPEVPERPCEILGDADTRQRATDPGRSPTAAPRAGPDAFLPRQAPCLASASYPGGDRPHPANGP